MEQIELAYQYIATKNIDIVYSLLGKLKIKSPVTFSHSLEVAKFSLAVGQKVGLSNEDLTNLYTAALLHDIGKLGVEKDILHGSNLTEEEIDSIRYCHIQKTFEILKSKNLDEEIINIAYHHHERINGSGYPNHLKGDELSDLDRILQVADVTSAISMGRGYQVGLNTEKTEERLNELVTANLLDNKYVSAMIDVLDENCLPED